MAILLFSWMLAAAAEPSPTQRVQQMSEILALRDPELLEESLFGLARGYGEAEREELFDLSALLGEWLATFPNRHEPLGMHLGKIAVAIAEHGYPEDLQRLVDISRDLTARGVPGGEAMLIDLFEWRYRTTLVDLVETPSPPPLDLSWDGPVPTHLAGQSDAVKGAWRQYRGLTDGFAPEPCDNIDTYDDRPQLTAMVAELVVGQIPKHSPLLVFEGCPRQNTASLRVTREHVLLLSLLFEKRYEEAATRALPWAWAETSLISDYLDWLGLDWAALYLGGAVDGPNFSYLEALKRRGGEEAALAALLLGEGLTDPTARQEWLLSLDNYVVRKNPDHLLPMWDTIAPETISEATQQRVLAALSAAIHPGATDEELLAALSVMDVLDHPESVRAIKRALSLGSPEVRKEARSVLRGM